MHLHLLQLLPLSRVGLMKMPSLCEVPPRLVNHPQPQAETGEAAVGAAAGRVEPDGLLAFAERVGETAKAYERGGAVAAARGALWAQRHGTVVVPQSLPVLPLLIPLVA